MGLSRLLVFPTLAGLLLAGCSVGIKQDDAGAIKGNFHVATTYQDAYRRADTFARRCHTTTHNVVSTSFNVTGNLYTDEQKGVLHVSAPGLAADMERIDLAATSGGGTDIEVTVWGRHQWDQREIDAAKRSIESGTPACR